VKAGSPAAQGFRAPRVLPGRRASLGLQGLSRGCPVSAGLPGAARPVPEFGFSGY